MLKNAKNFLGFPPLFIAVVVPRFVSRGLYVGPSVLLFGNVLKESTDHLFVNIFTQSLADASRIALFHFLLHLLP